MLPITPASPSDAMRIIVVEDQTLLLDSLAAALDEQEDMEVVDKLTDARQAPERCRELQPDLILMDVCTDGGSSGFDAARIIRRDLPDIKVVMMTAMPDLSFIETAKEAGAHSFIYKNIQTSELLSVLRSTNDNYSTFPKDPEMPILGYNKLNDREIQVLREVCKGLTRKEIAESHNLSENTIKATISSILTKTGYSSISRLAMYALSSGFIVVGDEGAPEPS